MSNKIISIKKLVTSKRTVKLPDGNYSGLWSGYTIELRHSSGMYRLETEEGIRGINIPVTVSVVDGVATFNH